MSLRIDGVDQLATSPLSPSGRLIDPTEAPGVGGGPPGTWTQLAKGPTTIADNTSATVLAGVSLAAGELPTFLATMKTTPATGQTSTRERTQTIVSGVYTHIYRKQTSGLTDFKIKHNSGSAQEFDWVAYKVVPA